MRASHEEIQAYIEKGNMTQRGASELLRELMELETLNEDYDSPVMRHLKEELEKSMKFHARSVLKNVKPDEKYLYECKCGEKIDLHKIYYQTIGNVWLWMQEIVTRWHKKNRGIKEGSRR